MDKERLAEELRAVQETVNSAGWKLLSRDWATDIKNLEKQVAYNAKDFNEVAAARGALNILSRLVRMEDALEAAARALAEPEPEEE